MERQSFDLREEYWGRGREGNIDNDLAYYRRSISELTGEVTAIEEELDRRVGRQATKDADGFDNQSSQRLKLEHQKRQRRVRALEKRISDLQEMYWGEGREGNIDNDLADYRHQIQILNTEMAAIEEVLDRL